MEGPSLFLAAEQLAPFINQKILNVTGNTKIGKERLQGKKILDIFAWGKHLVFQFDTFALRVHFMLFGSFEATLNNQSITGDYKRQGRTPRLQLDMKNGNIILFSCSLQYIEHAHAKETYDFTRDIMSDEWNSSLAVKKILENTEEEIGDVLLDQNIFSGVGNIIKNEVLFLEKIPPTKLVKNITRYKLNKIVKTTKDYVQKFYEWRKQFELRKHYQIYKKHSCPRCKAKIPKLTTGKRKRYSYFCPHCQKP